MGMKRRERLFDQTDRADEEQRMKQRICDLINQISDEAVLMRIFKFVQRLYLTSKKEA